MKIYNRIALDMNTWEVLEEDSFEYDGPLALCDGGGSDTEVVAPSAEETALQKKQLEILNSQTSEEETLKPYLYQSMGLKQNADGSLSKMSDAEYYNSLNETQKLQYDTTKLQQERLKKALTGSLPVSTALENDITDQEATLRNTLAQKLGADYEQSTPGLQALAEFNKKATELREASRKDEINSGTALALNQMGFLKTSGQNDTTMFSNLPSRYTSLMNNTMNAQQPYSQQRNWQYQADKSNAANAQAGNNQMMAAGGTAVGAAAAAAK